MKKKIMEVIIVARKLEECVYFMSYIQFGRRCRLNYLDLIVKDNRKDERTKDEEANELIKMNNLFNL